MDSSKEMLCSLAVALNDGGVKTTTIVENSTHTTLVYLPVDLGDLTNPDLPLPVFHVEDIVDGPMEVVGDVGYLLVDLFQGVAQYPPKPVPISTSNSCLQAGQLTWMVDAPSSLILR